MPKRSHSLCSSSSAAPSGELSGATSLSLSRQLHKRVLPPLRPLKPSSPSNDLHESVPLPLSEQREPLLHFSSFGTFRTVIGLSALSGRPVRLTGSSPVKESQVAFLKLMDSISHNTHIEIDAEGREVVFRPGLLSGGDPLGLFQAAPASAGGLHYLIEGVLLVAPFAKRSVDVTLTGVTHSAEETTCDALKTVTLPLLKHFSADLAECSIKVTKRGFAPLGGGSVSLHIPIVRSLETVDLTDEGKIKRVRGLATACRVSAQIANRVIDAAKGELLRLLPDVHIYGDHFNGKDSGLSPGYALCLVSESTSGSRICTEEVNHPNQLDDPDQLGCLCAHRLLREIAKGGYIDSLHQQIALIFMALGPKSVSRVRFGPLTSYSVQVLRLLQHFFGVTFHLMEESKTNTVLATVVGIGFSNLNRKTT